MLSRTQVPRRQLTLMLAGIGVIVAVVAAALLPVPYVIFSPGPTFNTLGSSGGHPVIDISGHRTYPVNGHLTMLTVSLSGGPSHPFNVFTALRSWLSPHQAVVPEAEVYGPGQTQQQVRRQDSQEMTGSQQTATVAALCLLRVPFTSMDTVTGTAHGLPAASVLRKGDVITAVDGTPVDCRHSAGTLIRSHRPGTHLTFTIRRNGAIRNIGVGTASYQGHTVVGVMLSERYRLPFTVNIRVGNVGGPSAGLMFALGIVDKLTPGSLTDGRFIAGTGVISASGAVGPIGGIQQKLAGARAAGATIFLTPAANCPDTAGAVPAGMRLVKVSTLAGAVTALHALAAGKPVRGC